MINQLSSLYSHCSEQSKVREMYYIRYKRKGEKGRSRDVMFNATCVCCMCGPAGVVGDHGLSGRKR